MIEINADVIFDNNNGQTIEFFNLNDETLLLLKQLINKKINVSINDKVTNEKGEKVAENRKHILKIVNENNKFYLYVNNV